MSKRITMQQIADAVKMSRASVSAVLGNKPHCFVSEKKREQIHQTALRMGYTPNLLARGLRNGRTNTIGLLCSSLQSEMEQQEMIYLTNLLFEHGYSSNTVYYKGEMPRLRTSCSELLARGCDALIVSRAQHGNEEHCIANSFTDKTVFLFAGNPDKSSDRDIVYDYRSGFLEAAEHLEKLGHRQIKMIKLGTSSIDPGMAGFQEALRQLHMDSESPVSYASAFEDITPDYMKHFFHENPSCTAVICRNDITAMRVIQCCTKLGIRVPEDFSVIGFDDIYASRFSLPALTTIHQPIEAAANEAVNLLLNLLENRSFPIRHNLTSRLIIRESTAVKSVFPAKLIKA